MITTCRKKHVSYDFAPFVKCPSLGGRRKRIGTVTSRVGYQRQRGTHEADIDQGRPPQGGLQQAGRVLDQCRSNGGTGTPRGISGGIWTCLVIQRLLNIYTVMKKVLELANICAESTPAKHLG